MCGIAGYVGNFNESILKKMTDKIAHRGPDGSGHWVCQEAGLGHRRLSIIDLSEQASQPMEAVEGRYQIVFNGEIYNFKALAADLKDKGYVFNENSDTAILAPLYDAYGESMVHKLDGIFAFAIWDKQEKSLFAARDHLGMKPFYYAETSKGFVFSSELKALLEIEQLEREIDHEAVLSYVRYLWCAGEHTMLKGVKKLLPGHFMTVSEDCLCLISKWYDVPLTQNHEEKTPEELLSLFDEVVADQTVSDVPVGAFLSGGVDSSAIVTSMKKHLGEPFDTFCIGFEGEEMAEEGFSNDAFYANQVAKQTGVNLHHITIQENFVHDLKDMVYNLDEPQADPAPLFVKRICKEAKKKGVKVMLSGSGGDDVFSGYRRHQVTAMLEKYDFIPEKLQTLAVGVLKNLAHKKYLKRRLSKLHEILKSPKDKRLLHAFYYTEPKVLYSLLGAELKQAYDHQTADYLEKVLESSKDFSSLDRQLNLELHGFLPDHNLNYTDKMSMASGVEVRTPFTSKKIIDFAFKLPLHQKVQGREAKWLLKKAFEKRLSPEILYRSKAGFGAPVRHWLLKEEEFVRSVLFSKQAMIRGLFNAATVKKLLENTKTGKTDGSYTILSLLVIELWINMFIEN
ncbi:MAG: asparagine synthase (glutamine-hydrolyzing) [Magnetococcales bacterium]|nr:asparagine synthase (glutamine-hydrolyzing) [Magnetococcales bacterium]|tara:strand:- start:264 stop:2135 length:1872 start_codon:yes stop_codon:yes gene_type:complete